MFCIGMYCMLVLAKELFWMVLETLGLDLAKE